MADKSKWVIAGGVRTWLNDCGFSYVREGAEALGFTWRTLTRWNKTGIPDNSYRPHILDKMESICTARKAKKKRGK